MKKTMKKTLAILVAILMIVTTIPMAFAAEGETMKLYLKISDGCLTMAMVPSVYVKNDEENISKVNYNSCLGDDTYEYIVPADSKFVYWDCQYAGGSDDLEYSYTELLAEVDTYYYDEDRWYCSHGMNTSGVKNCRGQVCEICGENYGVADSNAHDWSNCDGVCANGCGTICVHKDEEGEFCSVCGKVIGYELADFSELSVAMQLAQFLVESRFADASEKAGFNERLASELEEIYGIYPNLRLQQYPKEEQATVDAAVAEIFAMCEAANADLLAGEYGLAISYYTYYRARYEYSKYEFDKGMTDDEFENYCKDFFSEEAYENICNISISSENKINGVEEWLASGGELDRYAVESFYEASFAIKELCENMAVCLLAKEHTYTVCSTVTERPVYDEETDTWSKGICLLACKYCGRKSSETVSVDRGDYSAYEEAVSGLRELLATENLMTAVRDGYTNNLNATEAYFPKNLTALEQSSVDSQVAILNGYADYISSGIADGSLIKADYSPLKVLLDRVMELIDNKPSNIIGPYYGLYASPNGYYTGSVNSSVEQSAQSQKGYLESFTANLEELITLLETGRALKADYTEIDEAIEALDEKLADVNLTDEAKAELEGLKAQLEGMKHNPISSKADVEELMNALDSFEEDVEDGSAVEVDGITEYFNLQDAFNEALLEKYGEETVQEYAEKIGDKYDERFGELYNKANALTGSLADNKEAIAEIEAELEAIFAEFEKCLAGEHTIAYEEVDKATCFAAATEAGNCEICGEFKQREVEDSIADHIDEDDDLLCDFGCGHKFTADDEGENPDDSEEGTCPVCGETAHEGEVSQYICLLIMLIRIIINIVSAMK